MASAFIAIMESKNNIIAVFVEDDGEIDSLGMNLIEYFNSKSEVKKLFKGSIEYIDEDEVIFNGDDEKYFYSSKDELVEDMTSNVYYYLFDDVWYVSKPNLFQFEELECVLEKEY